MDNKHVYCIQPGTSLKNESGYQEKPFGEYNANFIATPAKRNLISQILTYAENLGTSVKNQ